MTVFEKADRHMSWGLCREVRNAHANLEVISKYQVLGPDVNTDGEVLRTESYAITTVQGR